jgi:hypothetical protein
MIRLSLKTENQMSYKEIYNQWVATNQAINAGALHETAADEILQDMIVAYREENNLYENGEPVEDSVVMEMALSVK